MRWPGLFSDCLVTVADDDAACGVCGRSATSGEVTSGANVGITGRVDTYRNVFNGIIFSHRLHHAGFEVLEAIESVAIGGKSFDGDGLHHWRHVGREQGAVLHLADRLINQVDSHVVVGAVAPFLKNNLRADGRVKFQSLLCLREHQTECSTDAGEVGVVAAEESELSSLVVQLLVDGLTKG